MVLRRSQLPKANIVLLGGDKKIGTEPMPFGYQFLELRSKEDMMVSKAFENSNLSTELEKRISERFRLCDSCKTHDPFPSDEIRAMGVTKVRKNETFRHVLALERRLGPEFLPEIVHHDEVGPLASPREMKTSALRR